MTHNKYCSFLRKRHQQPGVAVSPAPPPSPPPLHIDLLIPRKYLQILQRRQFHAFKSIRGGSPSQIAYKSTRGGNPSQTLKNPPEAVVSFNCLSRCLYIHQRQNSQLTWFGVDNSMLNSQCRGSGTNFFIYIRNSRLLDSDPTYLFWIRKIG